MLKKTLLVGALASMSLWANSPTSITSTESSSMYDLYPLSNQALTMYGEGTITAVKPQEHKTMVIPLSIKSKVKARTKHGDLYYTDSEVKMEVKSSSDSDKSLHVENLSTLVSDEWYRTVSYKETSIQGGVQQKSITCKTTTKARKETNLIKPIGFKFDKEVLRCDNGTVRTINTFLKKSNKNDGTANLIVRTDVAKGDGLDVEITTINITHSGVIKSITTTSEVKPVLKIELKYSKIEHGA